jgi:hypothetical protein
MTKPKVEVSPNMTKVRQYINANGDIIDKPKGKVIKKKEVFNINDVPKEKAEPKGSLEDKIAKKINDKIEAVIDKKIDEVLSKIL